MDEKAQRKIDEINASIPDELKSGLIEKKEDTELLEQKARAEFALKELHSGLGRTTGNITARQREALEKNLKNFLENTDFTKQVEKVNPRVAGKIDRYLEETIKKQIREGKLNPASKTDFNDFMRHQSRR